MVSGRLPPTLPIGVMTVAAGAALFVADRSRVFAGILVAVGCTLAVASAKSRRGITQLFRPLPHPGRLAILASSIVIATYLLTGDSLPQAVGAAALIVGIPVFVRQRSVRK